MFFGWRLFFVIFREEIVGGRELFCTFAVSKWDTIVQWCNGSTTDSGPVCLGSNPGRTTKSRLQRPLERLFCFIPLEKSGLTVDFIFHGHENGDLTLDLAFHGHENGNLTLDLAFHGHENGNLTLDFTFHGREFSNLLQVLTFRGCENGNLTLD